MTMPFYTLNQIHPRKRADFTAMEIAEKGAIFAHVRSHLIRGTLTATIRREASHGALGYIKTIYPDIASIPRTSQTEGLVRAILAGYASKANAVSILSEDAPIIVDVPQMKTAIRASGCKVFDTIYTLAQLWWEGLEEGITSPPVIVSAKKQQEMLKEAYRMYHDDPSPTTAEQVVIALLPVSECRVCLQTGIPPTLEQASRARARSYSHGRGYAKAVQAYIDHTINSKKE